MPLEYPAPVATCHPSKLLSDSLAFQALRAGEDVKTCSIVPPKLGPLGSFRADPIIIDLPYIKHGRSTTFGNVIPLNPQRHSVELTLIFSGFADDLDCIRVVLNLTEHQFERIEPFDTYRRGMELDQNNAVAMSQNFKETGIHFNRRAT